MATQKILTRDFVLCFFAQFTFSSVFYVLIPTLPIYLSRLGAKEAEIGVLIGVFSVSLGAVMMGIILQLTSYPVMFLCLALTGIINFFYFYFAVMKKPQETPASARVSPCPPELAIVWKE